MSGSADHTARIWSFRDRRVAPVSLSHAGIVTSVVFSPDGGRLASVASGAVRVWNMSELDSPPALLEDRHGIRSVVFSPTSTALGFFTITNPLTLARLNQLRIGPPVVLAQPAAIKRTNLHQSFSEIFFADARIGYVAALSDDWTRLASFQPDGSILVWDTRRPDLPPVRLAGHRSYAMGVAFASDRNPTLLASAGQDLAVRVWDLDDPDAPLLTFQGSGYFLAFSLDDTRLLAGGRGADEAHMWDLREPAAPPIVFQGGGASIRSAALSRDGTHLALGDTDGNVWFWSLWNAAADDLCSRVTRNLSLREWRAYVGESIPYERTCPALPAGPGVPTAGTGPH